MAPPSVSAVVMGQNWDENFSSIDLLAPARLTLWAVLLTVYPGCSHDHVLACRG